MSFHKMSKDNINEMVNINYIHSKKFSEQNLKSKVNSFWENLGEKN